jgi:hypothetical protein
MAKRDDNVRLQLFIITRSLPDVSVVLDLTLSSLISDVGATKLQPLFIVGSSIMGVCFILSLVLDRLLRHQGRLPVNLRRTEKTLGYLAILGSVIGATGVCPF